MAKSCLARLPRHSVFIFCLGFIGILLLPRAIDWYKSVDGGYTEWSAWGECSPTCGIRLQKRFRACTNPLPKGNGKNCELIGPNHMVQNCLIIECPINGNWGNWGPWSKCEPNCKEGTKKRVRLCDNPKPQNGGSNCNGAGIINAKCSDHHVRCPINGGLGSWGSWTDCSKTCDEGVHKRFRLCNNPDPEFGGKNCTEHLTETTKCNLKTCDKN